MSFAEARLREGFLSPELQLAVIPQRRLVHRRRAAAPVSARARLAAAIELRVGDYVVHEDHGIARFSGFDTKTLAGVTRDYLELEYRGGDRVFAPTDQLARISRYMGADGRRARAQPPRRKALAEHEVPGAPRRPGDGRRSDQPLRRAPGAQGPRLLARRRDADGLRGGLSLSRDRRSDGRDRRGQGRHGVGAADGPPDLRRRRLRQDRDRAARRPQGGGGRQAGDDARADHDPRPAALRHLPRALRGYAVQRRDGLPAAQAGRGQAEPRALPRGEGGRPDRYPPAALARRPGQGPRPDDRRRGAALRREAEGASPAAEAQGGRALALGHADPAHSADVARRPARHLRDRDPARGPPPGAHARRSLRRGPGQAGDRAREGARAGRSSSSTTGSTRCTRPPSGSAPSVPACGFAEAHGQMDELQLEATMLAFVRGEHDVLVATTIIESGLDIPTANTLLVERADQLGLAQAYQIRGRVGRSRRAGLRLPALPLGRVAHP